MFDFSGKTVLVTGASRGIGRAIALAFGAAGAEVILVSRKQDALEKVRGEIEAKGGRAHTAAANLGRMDDIRSLLEKAFSVRGRIDVLVNNAATNPVFFPLVAIEERAWDKIMDVNLKGPFFLTVETARKMIDRKSGAIVNVASTAGMRSWVGLGVYGISKAGLMQMTRQMAREWAEAGVRVNAVAPGLVDTDFSRVLIDTDIMRDEALKTAAIKRPATVDEITGAVLFLASDSARFITGQTLVVDGGSST
jgi:dehydrogenase/reductase SDR family protein 4